MYRAEDVRFVCSISLIDLERADIRNLPRDLFAVNIVLSALYLDLPSVLDIFPSRGFHALMFILVRGNT